MRNTAAVTIRCPMGCEVEQDVAVNYEPSDPSVGIMGEALTLDETIDRCPECWYIFSDEERAALEKDLNQQLEQRLKDARDDYPDHYPEDFD